MCFIELTQLRQKVFNMQRTRLITKQASGEQSKPLQPMQPFFGGGHHALVVGPHYYLWESLRIIDHGLQLTVPWLHPTLYSQFSLLSLLIESNTNLAIKGISYWNAQHVIVSLNPKLANIHLVLWRRVRFVGLVTHRTSVRAFQVLEIYLSAHAA